MLSILCYFVFVPRKTAAISSRKCSIIFTSVQDLTNHDCFILLDFIVLPLMKFNAQLLCEGDELNNFCLPTINFYIITGFSSRRLHF